MPRRAETPYGDRLLLRLEAIVVGLGLDRCDLVVFGSAPIFAHGLRPDVRDLDIVARGAAWDGVQSKGKDDTGTVNGAPMVSFWEGHIQFSRGWISPEWDADALIDRAETIGGLPFAALTDVLAYKEQLRAMEPAVRRLADQDSRFFSDKTHPARQLLDRITQRSLCLHVALLVGGP